MGEVEDIFCKMKQGYIENKQICCDLTVFWMIRWSEYQTILNYRGKLVENICGKRTDMSNYCRDMTSAWQFFG